MIYRRSQELKAESASWENVLLQISLAFTIILGYLVAQNASWARSLEGQVRLSRRAITRLKNTTAGQFALGQAKAEKALQKMELLAEWRRLRPTRPLFRLLVRLDDVDRIHLAPAGSRPSDEAYDELLKEGRRVFGDPDADVSPAEIKALLAEVCRRCGYTEKSFSESLERATSPEFLQDVMFRPESPDAANLRDVAHEIRKSLEDERKQVRRLQLRLVERICVERLSDVPIASEASDPQELLRELVGQLKQSLGLLPEVERELLSGI